MLVTISGPRTWRCYKVVPIYLQRSDEDETGDWSIKEPEELDLDKFRRYLRDNGHGQSTIDSYLMCISKFLKSKESGHDFLDGFHIRKLAGSTIDNYITSIKKYHEMLGEPISIPYLKRSKGIPHYFDEDGIRNCQYFFGSKSCIYKFRHSHNREPINNINSDEQKYKPEQRSH